MLNFQPISSFDFVNKRKHVALSANQIKGTSQNSVKAYINEQWNIFINKPFNMQNFYLLFKICYAYLLALYLHPLLDPDKDNISLQNKVMFNIHFYFCHRGTENMYTMTRNTFQLNFDKETHITYLEKVCNEMTKKWMLKYRLDLCQKSLIPLATATKCAPYIAMKITSEN